MKYLFADEAGNFDFSLKGSKHYIITAVSMPDFACGVELLELRHDLAYVGAEMAHDGFHASEEKQYVRDEVFKLIAAHNITIDAVVLEKRKTLPRIAANEHYFYKLAWHFLFQHIVDRCFPVAEQGLVVAGSLGTKKKQEIFSQAVADVASQHRHQDLVRAVSWSAASHPCLQIADYCCWAIQRYYELNDDRSFVLIKSQIASCFEPFRLGQNTYY